MKKAVIFDCDGTLIDSFELFDIALNEACKKYKYYILTEEEKAHLFGPNELGLIAKLIYPEDVKKAYFEYLKMYEKYHDKYIPSFIDGIEDLLIYLNKKEDIEVYLLTGRSIETTVITLDKLNAFKYFKDSYYGSHIGQIKAKLLTDLGREHNLKFEDMLYIGDSREDIKQCKEVGVDIISVSYVKPSSFDDLNELNPNNVVKTVKELKKKINDFI